MFPNVNIMHLCILPCLLQMKKANIRFLQWKELQSTNHLLHRRRFVIIVFLTREK